MNKLNFGTRIGSMVLDQVIMIFSIIFFVAFGVLYNKIQNFVGGEDSHIHSLGNFYFNSLAISLYFNKDMFLGRSPAKRIFKLQIVDIKNHRPANPLRCLVRNITLILFPIELIAGLINNERRIGDFIAGTKLTVYEPEKLREKPKWILVILTLMIGMLIVNFLYILILKLLTLGVDGGFALGISL